MIEKIANKFYETFNSVEMMDLRYPQIQYKNLRPVIEGRCTDKLQEKMISNRVVRGEKAIARRRSSSMRMKMLCRVKKKKS